jgi:hypothetical protein
MCTVWELHRSDNNYVATSHIKNVWFVPYNIIYCEYKAVESSARNCCESEDHFSDTKVDSINQASGVAAVLNVRYELLCFGAICC